MNKERNRLSVFIDGGHYNAIQRYYQADFDFPLFMQEARKRLSEEIGPLSVVHTFYYDCEPYIDGDSTAEQKEALSRRRSYFNFLRTQSVRVREGTLVKRTAENGQVTFQQKRVDLLLGLDIAEECSKGLISRLVLVAGDADLVPAVEFASRREIQVWLLHSPRSVCSDALWLVADGRIEIDAEFARLVSKSPAKQTGAME